MVSIVFVRGLAVTMYAIGGLCVGFYVQHTLTARAEATFEVSVATAIDAAIAVREARVVELEKMK